MAPSKSKNKEDENIAFKSRKPRSKKMEIVCSDQGVFHVSKLCALESCVVNNYIKDGFVGPIRLQFTSRIISAVLDFCKKHAEARIADDKHEAHEKLKDFDSEFLKENQSVLVDLLHVSMRLQIRSLLDLTSEAVVDMINGKSGENIVAFKSRKPRSKKVEIVCSDQVSFHVSKMYALESCVVKNRIIYGFVSPIRLEFISQIISLVLEFCKKHAEARIADDKHGANEKLKDFDSEFLKVNQSVLVDLLNVSMRLQIRSLLDLTSEAVVDMINGKPAEEIHKMLNMEQDLNPEDIEMLLELDGWCFK